MNNDQKHELGEEAVKIVNELSTDRFRVILPGRQDAIKVADKIIDKLIELQIRKNG